MSVSSSERSWVTNQNAISMQCTTYPASPERAIGKSPSDSRGTRWIASRSTRGARSPIRIFMVAQPDGDAAHDAAVAGRAARVFLIGQPAGFERLFPSVDHGERALG